MPNRPEFLAIWLGITRVGGVVALLNTNLIGMALAHCINVVAPKHIIVDAELLRALQSAQPHLTSNAKIWLHGDAAADLPRIDREIEALSGDALAAASAARSPSRIARCSSTRPAPPACPRPPTSTTTG